MQDDQNLSIWQKIAKASHIVVDDAIDKLTKANPTMKQPYGSQIPAMRRTWSEDLERLNSEYGYRQKLTLLTDNHKLLMYLKDPIIAAIVQTRVNQICTFSTPQEDKYSPGFMFKKKDRTEISEEEKETIAMLNDFIMNTGIVDEERDLADENMPFRTWLALCIKDAMIYDTLCTEIVPDNANRVHHWLPVSSATMRLTAKNLNDKSLNDDIFENVKKEVDPEKLESGQYKYVQVTHGQMRKVYTRDEIVMEFRNPINDLFTNGYPVGELDLLMNVVSAHLNADQYNRSIFTNGITSQGIINLKGEIDDEQLKAMRRSWYNQGVGPEAMFRTPIVNTPDGMEFIKLDTAHKDLEYSQYIEYLIKVMCAIYQIDPEEIGFTSGASGGGSAGNSQNYNNVERKVQMSRDKGLRPLLTFLEGVINDRILPRFSKDLAKIYKFEFVGLKSEDRMDELMRLEKEVRSYKTVNEVRAAQGLPAIEGADFIIDGTYMQWYMAMSKEGQAYQAQQAQQMQGGGPGGAPGEEGVPEEGEGDIQYVDEQGNPIDPSQIDPDKMSFSDDEGNITDHEGNIIEEGGVEEPEETAEEEGGLPWEAEAETGEETLPFEEATEESKSKLPFEE